MTEIEGLFIEAEDWLSERIDKEDICKYTIVWDGIFVNFTKKSRKLRESDILEVANNSNDIIRAWKDSNGSSYINIQYYNSASDRIHIDEIYEENWFKMSLSWMISCGLIFEKVVDVTFAKYHPLYSSQSSIDFDELEKTSGRKFEFERNFHKPKNKLYATIET